MIPELELDCPSIMEQRDDDVIYSHHQNTRVHRRLVIVTVTALLICGCSIGFNNNKNNKLVKIPSHDEYDQYSNSIRRNNMNEMNDLFQADGLKIYQSISSSSSSSMVSSIGGVNSATKNRIKQIDNTLIGNDNNNVNADRASGMNVNPKEDDDVLLSSEEIIDHQPKVGRGTENSKVVWLLSFPNSGTSYTLSNTEKISGSSTGSNYAFDWDNEQQLVPIHAESKNGPFFHRPNMSYPEYVLTKTHCASYCNDCSPDNYAINSTKQFRDGCATASRKDASSGRRIESRYSKTFPVKIVHLLRNPFDNIVSRIHSEIKSRPFFENLTNDQKHALLSSRDGFESWCEYTDKKFEEEEKHTTLLSDEIKNIFKDLPCHADWYRYIQWHNYAISIMDELSVPTHTLYYEEYDTKYKKTVDTLFDFLHLQRINEPIEFVPRKSYDTYFTHEDSRAAIRLVRTLATPKSWNRLKHYFDKWV